MSLGSSALGAKDLRERLASASFSEVTLLDVSDNPVGTEGLIAIGESPHTGKLRSLNASKLNAEDAGAEALAKSATLAPESLWLRYNAFTAKGVAALANSRVLSKVELLDLGFNPVGDEGASALAASPYVGALEHLDLTSTKIGDVGAAALMDSDRLAGLDSLKLTMNALTPEAIKPLLDPKKLPALSYLAIPASAVSDADKAQLLAARPKLAFDLQY